MKNFLNSFDFFKKQISHKSIYINDFIPYFDGPTSNVTKKLEWENFIKTNTITKQAAEELEFAIELIFIDDKLKKIYKYDNGVKKVSTLSKEYINLPYIEIRPNQIYELLPNNNSNSYLGGSPPSEIIIPSIENTPALTYLGLLSNSDSAYEWLPFDLHLFYPMFIDYAYLFIDYSDVKSPIVTDYSEYSDNIMYDQVDNQSFVRYKKIKFKPTSSNRLGYTSINYNSFGNSWVPEWIQRAEIPICPKSNKLMKFVCQLNIGPETENTNIIPSEYDSFEKMNFVNGDLYVFFEPNSKMACLFLQVS